MAHMERAADVPAHMDRHKDPADFVALDKSLRACFVCRLVKSQAQFEDMGCDNCEFLELKGDRGRVLDYTTPNFSGVITVMDPTTSWATKWLHLSKYVPGCYSLMINDEPPDALQDMCENHNISLRTHE